MDTKKPVLLFDGVCNYCNRTVNFIIRNNKKATVLFSPLQSDTAKLLLEKYGIPASADTIVLIENGKPYLYAKAAIRVCKYLDWPAKALYAFAIVPNFISQPVYKWFARHRYKWFGKKDSCMVPSPSIKDRFLP